MSHLIKHRITRRQSLTLMGAALAAMMQPSAPLLANTDARLINGIVFMFTLCLSAKSQ
ncbi:hypothetical protein J7J47_02460 [Halomonas sp. ISL-60]|uniref:hypothetical protein n=1 Tax=Halomonas sp. ISL-56 TaxID=2819149 RepID=UPI001BE72352|nr:hypothetical protein [Halomonas sp. ISL-56]MBT2771093.1 hypothetical protein [Halomonas sp. ISL-60]MBT2799831.1 hypothetical protein [Halomonas sp. ISL-56]